MTALFRLWLSEAVQRRNLTHDELARRSGIDRSTVTRILNEQRGATLETAARLLEALDGEPLPAELHRLARLADRPTWIRQLLSEDPRLGAADVEAVMELYLERRGHPPVL